MACGQRKENASQAEAPPPAESLNEGAPKVAAEPTFKVTAPKPAPPLSPEISAATVCVRINIASTRQKAYAGVILAANTIDPPLEAGSNTRLVAALMPDCNESILKDKSCVIRVLRNKGENQNNAQALPLKATLLNFDDKTHLALWLMSETFAVRLDPGLGASKSISKPSVLLTHCDVSGGEAIQAALTGASLSGSGLQLDRLPEATGGILDTAAVLDAEGKVSGFAQRQASESWQYVPLSVPKVAIPKPRYLVRDVALKSFTEKFAILSIHGDLDDPFHEMDSNRILLQNTNLTGFRPAEPGKDPPLIEASQTFSGNRGAEGRLSFTVQLQPEETAGSFMLQVVLNKGNDEELCHSAPFLVVLKRRGSGLYLSSQGVEAVGLSSNTNANAGEPRDAPNTGFIRHEITTESPIQYGFPIAEGREELIRLEQAPYWKRLSLVKGEWLQLPDVDLSTAKLAGNKEALFVWLPTLHEIRRYRLADLALENSMKLPEEISIVNLTAGACSSGAPLALVTNQNVIACDPKSLSCDFIKTIPTSDRTSISTRIHFVSTGDGMGIKSHRDRKDTQLPCPEFIYRGPVIGFPQTEHTLYAENDIRLGPELTVNPSFVVANTMEYPGADGAITKKTIWKSGETLGTFANSPSYYVVSRHGASSTSNQTPLISLYSDFATHPVLTFDAPELLDLPSQERDRLDGRIWFDPYSLSVALWHHDKTITVRSFDKSKLPVPKTPALLNYPDTFVPRGGTFKFTPLILGDPKAKLSVDNAPAGFRVNQDGSMQWECAQDLPADELSVSVLLQDQSAQTSDGFGLPLRIGGVRPVLVLPHNLGEEAAADAARAISTGNGAKPNFAVLNSHIHHSDRPIQKILPAVGDYISLQFRDGSVGLYSTKEWRVTVRHQFEPNASLFPAGNAILSYNPANRTLTRYLLPQLTPSGSLTMPGSTKLTAIGVGSLSTGPVTLFLEGVIARERYMDLDGIYTFSYLSHALRIVDMETLREGKWAQFAPYEGPGKDIDTQGVLQFYHGGASVLRLPTSSDGRVVVFPSGRLLVTPTITTDCPSIPPTPISPSEPLVASSTGDRIFESAQLHVAGMNGQNINYPLKANMSPCGNYVAQTQDILNAPKKRMAVSILSTENLEPLLQLPELDILKVTRNFEQNRTEMQLYPMGDKNLLTLLSKDGSTLQIIDFNLPEVYKKVLPESVIVTSHPFPAVAAGNTMTYQIQVNNPEKVAGYQLRNPVEGAQVDSTGKFSYKAPQEVGAPMQVNVVIDLKLTNGQSISHTFPISVISPKTKPAPASKGKPGTTI